MAADTDITPEEKLLRVIQQGGKEPDAVSTSTPDVSESLAVESSGERETGANVVVPPAETETETVTQSFHTVSVVMDPLARHLRAACRLLMLVVVLLLLGGGYELLRAVPAPIPEPQAPDPAFLDPIVEPWSMQRVDDAVNMYRRRRIFGRPPAAAPVEDQRDEPVRLTGWQEDVRDNFRLMGISIVRQTGDDGVPQSVREAIVLNANTGNMLFLAPGKMLVIKGSHVKVRTVLADAVVLESNDTELVIGKQ